MPRQREHSSARYSHRHRQQAASINNHNNKTAPVATAKENLYQDANQEPVLMARLKWVWQYTSTNGDTPSGHGKLVTGANPNKNGFYRVRSIKGQVDGVQIDKLLPAGTGIPGNVDPITGTPYLGDNRLRAKNLDINQAQLTSSGLIFKLKDASYSNLFYGTYPPQPSYYEFHTVPPYPDGLVPPNTESFINFSARISKID